jgi:hypothetical protein
VSNRAAAELGFAPYRPVKPIHLIRYGLPAGIVAAGIVVIIVGSGHAIPTAAGITLIGVALLVLLVNALARLSISSQDDREREQQAREQPAQTQPHSEPGHGPRHEPHHRGRRRPPAPHTRRR